jgi:hypothetical protein
MRWEYLIVSSVCLGMFVWGIFLGQIHALDNHKCNTLPTQVTDMFTVQGDTIFLKQNADFVISTRGIDIDTAGIIHRKNLHK